MPVAVGIGLTNECNLACPHCYRPTLTQQRLSLPQVETILDNLEVGSVNLGVGENGVHPEYREMLELFRFRKVKTAITSNGYSLAMLTDEELAGFHSVELSFDFPTKAEMEEFRGPGAWEMAIASLERCQRLGIPTSVAAVMMSTNYDRMGEVARFAFGLGCDLRVNVYQPVTGEGFTLSYEEFWQGFADLFAAGPVVVCSEPLVNAIMGLETTRGNPCGQRSIRALRGKLDEPDEYCPVVRGGEEEVRRVQEMLRYTLSDPEDVPKAGNACTTVIKTAGRLPA